jgi:hypothetical protein
MKAASKLDKLAEEFGIKEVAAILEWMYAQRRLAEGACLSMWDHALELARLREGG